MKSTVRINDEERRLWVLNDEGLYNEWTRSRKAIRMFIRENREWIDQCIRSALNR